MRRAELDVAPDLAAQRRRRAARARRRCPPRRRGRPARRSRRGGRAPAPPASARRSCPPRCRWTPMGPSRRPSRACGAAFSDSSLRAEAVAQRRTASATVEQPPERSNALAPHGRRALEDAAVPARGSSACSRARRVGAAIGVYLALHARSARPAQRSTTTARALASAVVDRNGQPIGEFFEERRRLTPLDEMPPHVVNAFVAGEDRRLLRAQGHRLRVDPARGVGEPAHGRRDQAGRSTITQQMVKSLLLSPERTYRAQDPRDDPRAAHRAALHEAGDPLPLPEPDLLRARRLRDRRGGAHLLRQGRVGDSRVARARSSRGCRRRRRAIRRSRIPRRAEQRRRYVLDRMLEDELIDASDARARDRASRRSCASSSDEDHVGSWRTSPRRCGASCSRSSAATSCCAAASHRDHARRGPPAHRGRGAAPRARRARRAPGLPRPAAQGRARGDRRRDREARGGERLRAAAARARGRRARGALAVQRPRGGGARAPGRCRGEGRDGERRGRRRGLGLAGGEPQGRAPDRSARGRAAARRCRHQGGWPGAERARGLRAGARGRGASSRTCPGRASPTRTPRRTRRLDREGLPPRRRGALRAGRRREGLRREAGRSGRRCGARRSSRSRPSRARCSRSTSPAARCSRSSAARTSTAASSTARRRRDASRARRSSRSSTRAALAKGYTASSILFDRPVVYVDETSGFVWRPQNYGKSFYGPITMREALARSVNNATVHLFRRRRRRLRDLVRAAARHPGSAPARSLARARLEPRLAARAHARLRHVRRRRQARGAELHPPRARCDGQRAARERRARRCAAARGAARTGGAGARDAARRRPSTCVAPARRPTR